VSALLQWKEITKHLEFIKARCGRLDPIVAKVLRVKKMAYNRPDPSVHRWFSAKKKG
jgi:dsDNA-specific endonuclease/ATPase MutS2